MSASAGIEGRPSRGEVEDGDKDKDVRVEGHGQGCQAGA